MAKLDNSTPISLSYLKSLRLSLIAKVGSIILETRHYCYHAKFCIPCRRKKLLLEAADITMRHALRWEMPTAQPTAQEESTADSGPLAGAVVLRVIEGGGLGLGEEFIAEERPSGVRRIDELMGELKGRGVRL